MSAAGERERLTQTVEELQAYAEEDVRLIHLADALKIMLVIDAVPGLLSRVTELEEALRASENDMAEVGNRLAGSPEPCSSCVEAIDRRIGLNRAVLAGVPATDTEESLDSAVYDASLHKQRRHAARDET